MSIKITNFRFVIDSIVTLLLFLLIIAIISKLKNGFFDRSVLFFLNGPIVFGRLMGIGATLCLMGIKSKKNNILFFIFTVAVIWTASKGPILALLISCLVYVLLMMNFRKKIASLLTVVVIALVAVNNLDMLTNVGLVRLVDAFNYYYGGIGDVSPTSVSVRQSAISESIEMFLQYPLFGVGVGGWAISIQSNGLMYPHNFFIEVFSEGGLILGGLFCIPYLIFFKNPRSLLFYTVLFLLISQQFSGDILDSRYWLVFSILSFYYYKYSHMKNPK
jgi:hypothetical protein